MLLSLQQKPVEHVQDHAKQCMPAICKVCHPWSRTLWLGDGSPVAAPLAPASAPPPSAPLAAADPVLARSFSSMIT